MKVIVVGAGIAGTATALALHKGGIDVTVHEARPPTGPADGAFLTLASNGMRALRQIDAAGVVAAAGYPLRSMRVRDGQGVEIAGVPLGDQDAETGYRYLTRASLCRVLHREARRRGIPITWGRRLVRAQSDTRSVTARFVDGAAVSGDLLIGADGLASTVRTIVDPAAAGPRYAGQVIFYGYSKSTAVTGPPDRFEVVRGAAVFGYIVTARRGTWWFARIGADEPHRREPGPASTAGLRTELRKLLSDDRVPTAEIVAGSPSILTTSAFDLLELPVWYRNRMLLVGDAAHAASPATGQGASMALEDAVILAKALREHPDHRAAMAHYERLRRGRVLDNIVASARMTGRVPVRPPVQPPVRRAADPPIEAQLDWAVPLV